MLLEQLVYVSFCFLVPVTNDKVSNEPARTNLGDHSGFKIRNAKLSYRVTENVAIYAFFFG